MKEDSIWIKDMERESLSSMKVEIGKYVNHELEGEFKIYDKEGNITIVH